MHLAGSRRPLLLGALVVAVVALTTALWVSSSSANAARHKTYFPQGGAAANHVIRPRTLVISSDGSFLVHHMRWSRWGSDRAHGAGIAAVDECNPNCAQGHIRHDPIRVTLSRPHHVCGRWFFGRVAVYFPKGHPKELPARDAFRFGAFCGH